LHRWRDSGEYRRHPLGATSVGHTRSPESPVCCSHFSGCPLYDLSQRDRRILSPRAPRSHDARMLWIAASLFFLWCAFREIRASLVPPPGFDRTKPIYGPYLAGVGLLAVLFAWPPAHTWYLESFLSRKATELADNHRARVHCNTIFDTMLDPAMLAAGHADP